MPVSELRVFPRDAVAYEATTKGPVPSIGFRKTGSPPELQNIHSLFKREERTIPSSMRKWISLSFEQRSRRSDRHHVRKKALARQGDDRIQPLLIDINIGVFTKLNLLTETQPYHG